MKTCILGSGALGSMLGGVLSAGGADIYLVDPWKEHVDAMNSSGLALVEGGEPCRVSVKASTNTVGLGAMDLVVIAVKSFDTARALTGAMSVIAPETVVLSLQSGLNDEAIAELVGEPRMLYGRTSVEAVIEAPGRVLGEIRGRATSIGEKNGSATERVRRFAETWSEAGIEVEISSNIVGALWDGLLDDVATGALSAITGMRYGELYQTPEVAACASEAVAEAVAVAGKMGVALAARDPAEVWRRASAGAPADFKAAMLRSVERGARTEIDAINGAVVRYGARLSVDTPVNRALLACVKGLERRCRGKAG